MKKLYELELQVRKVTTVGELAFFEADDDNGGLSTRFSFVDIAREILPLLHEGKPLKLTVEIQEEDEDALSN